MLLPVTCPNCVTQWKLPAELLTGVYLADDTHQLWFLCPNCGPAWFTISQEAHGIIEVHGADSYDWSVTDPAIAATLHQALYVELDPALREVALCAELERILGRDVSVMTTLADRIRNAIRTQRGRL